MNKNIRFGLAIAIAIAILLTTAQLGYSQSLEIIKSKEIIEKGVQLFDEEKYNESIEEYSKVTRNDTNYLLAQVEIVTTYINQKKDSLALLVCNNALTYSYSSYTPHFMLLKAAALDNLKRSDEAIKVYEEGAKKYPLNNSFYYEVGVLKLRQDKFYEAYTWFEKSMKVNPFHANTHFHLGFIAVKQGRLIPAMLAWQYYLTLDNSSSRAKYIVNSLEKMAKNEFDMEPSKISKEMENQFDFAELDALVKSKVALSPKYKSETKLKFDLTKQLQLIAEKIEVSPNDKGIYAQYYGNYFQSLYKQKMLEAFTYDILNGMNNDDVNSWTKKNKTKIEAFGVWMAKYVMTNIATYDEKINNETVKVQHRYNSNYKIASVGNANDKGESVGYWIYYYPNGIIKAEGNTSTTGFKDGVWKFYNNGGAIKSSELYSEGKLNGSLQTYYLNGGIATSQNYTMNQLNGEQIKYHTTGNKNVVYNYTNDVENGKRLEYFENGQLNYEINIINGKYDGPCTLYYMDGHMNKKITYVNNNRNGVSTEYYDVPENAKKNTINFENDIAIGHYETYHENGIIAEIGEINKEGMRYGVWKTFSATNKRLSEINYRDGKFDGKSIYFSYKGIKTEEYLYNNDLLQQYQAFDTEGKTIFTNNKVAKKDYNAKLYYSNGNVKREGAVVGGELSGIWKNYAYVGYLESEEPYVNGKKEGGFTDYAASGKIKAEQNYINDVLQGSYIEYHKNGVTKLEGNYVNGLKEGYWKRYFPNKALQAINYYEDDKEINYQQYYAANGKLINEDVYDYGDISKRIAFDSLGKIIKVSQLTRGSGSIEEVHKNGKPSWNVTYKNGLKQGPSAAYSNTGKPIYNFTFKDGRKEGSFKSYFANGILQREVTYVNGERNGKDLIYYENKNIKNEENYVNGLEEGRSIVYHPNKQIQIDYNYINDLLEGKSSIYDETGELMIVRNFENNILVSYQYFDKTGVLLPAIPVINETANIITYFKNGNKATEYSIKNAMLEGKRLQYHSNGKIADESFFVNNDREGVRTQYYPSGKIKATENWKNDLKHGACTYYHENGKVKLVENYLNNDKFGTETHFDELGKLLITYYYYNDELIDEK